MSDTCYVCGEYYIKGPPITPGSNGSVRCPYIGESWHNEATADFNKQDKTLHLQRRRRVMMECSCGFKGDTNEILQHKDKNPDHRIVVPGYEEKKAIRVSHPLRYDCIDPRFLEALARVADFGAKKYGDENKHESRLTGDKSPINHIYKHLTSYRQSLPYDHSELGSHRKWHLAAIAFNAMMEFYFEDLEDVDKS